jgi:hypothetical protein
LKSKCNVNSWKQLTYFQFGWMQDCCMCCIPWSMKWMFSYNLISQYLYYFVFIGKTLTSLFNNTKQITWKKKKRKTILFQCGRPAMDWKKQNLVWVAQWLSWDFIKFIGSFVQSSGEFQEAIYALSLKFSLIFFTQIYSNLASCICIRHSSCCIYSGAPMLWWNQPRSTRNL